MEFDEIGQPQATTTYRGAFNHLHNGNIFADESFEVFRHNKLFTLRFLSSLMSRTTTGEILKITVDYTVGKDWIPTEVYIDRTLGGESSQESFKYDNKTSYVEYMFSGDGRKTSHKISINPKFHIATPTALTSMIFVLSKKFDSTGKNHYITLTSQNRWKYQSIPEVRSISLDKISLTAESITINDNNLQAMQYNLYDADILDKISGRKNAPKPACLNVFLSNHLAIPYILKDSNGQEVQIRTLTDLTDN